ncbi:hypothetical protein B0H11DRAFT_2228318 [Mycena galericulata]|nr:hypothetical protein B0H11DRAFT_2228318 [Mycena galericulata]
MAPPPGQANIPSSLDRPPNWPSSLPSLRSVLDYLADCEPIALYRAEFGRDFLGPRQPYTQYDCTAFRTQDEVPFIGLLFGRVIKAPEFSWAHSTFMIDAGPPEATEVRAVFARQMSTLAAPVDYAEEVDLDNGAKTFVMHWSQPDIQFPTTGPCITVHLAHIGGAHCVQYAPGDPEFRIHGEDDELEVTTPLRASDYAFGVGDWILTTVTLHQRVTIAIDKMDSSQLVHIATQSVPHYLAVRCHLDGLEQSGHAPLPSIFRPNLSGMPPRVVLKVLQMLDIEDQIRLGQTCRSFATLASRALQDRAGDILKRFHLRFSEVRLLLTATKAVIAGSSVLAALSCVDISEPGDLDFFVKLGDGDVVVAFLNHAAGYREVSSRSSYDHSNGITNIWTLERETGEKINVIAGYTNNPYDSIFLFHSTPVFGAWAADGMWHGYARATTSRVAITTPPLLPVSDLRHTHVLSIVEKYRRRGFTFALNTYNLPHVCGTAINCPVTLRSTRDAGCLFVRFPTWNFSQDDARPAHLYWSLRGSGCKPSLMGFTVADTYWNTYMSTLLL